MPRSPAGGAPERPFAHLAEHLVALRRAARLPQRALAEAANVSRGAVQRAESGAAAPSTTVLDAYVRACSGNPADHARARLLRTRGRTAQRARLRHLKAPAPRLIHTEDDLGAALAAAYEQAGAPSLSDARLTPGRKPLPRTTAWRIVARRKLPPTAEQLVTFLTACGIGPAEQGPYVTAYERIIAERGIRPTPPPRDSRRSGRFGPDVEGRPERLELTGLAAAIVEQLPAATVEELLVTALAHKAGREAQRNGTVTPELIITLAGLIHPTRDDDISRTVDGLTALHDVTHHQRRPRPARTATASSWSYNEIAAHLRVQPETVRSYRKHGLLPPPDHIKWGRPCWNADTIRAWVASRPGGRARRDG